MSATELARKVVEAWIDAGVRHAVLCPGSRSAPLAFAADAAAREGHLELHTRLDERTAAFLALGAAKASRRPGVVFCTSGTAAANFHPAVLEAAHAAVPLWVVTADRPARLRGTGANQTTDQVDLYGDAASTLDIAEGAEPDWTATPSWSAESGPVHWNIQFEEPLVPSERDAAPVSRPPSPAADTPRRGAPQEGVVPRCLNLGPRTVVVAGDDSGPAARILAEPTSGARTGANPIGHYRLLLGTELADRIERVVVFGHPTLSRPVSRLLGRREVEVLAVPPQGRWPRHPFEIDELADAFVVPPDAGSQACRAGEEGWLNLWRRLDARLAAEIEPLVSGLTGYAVAREVSRAVGPGDRLLVGASNPIRDLDLMALAHPVGERRLQLANRGLAGIDGTLSTAVGVALTAREQARTLALMGDVTFLHDLTGLVLGPQERQPDLRVVVLNDDGGAIFASLEQGAAEFADRYERLFATPHGADLVALCTGLGVSARRVDSVEHLRQVLAEPLMGIDVVEVRCRRDERRTTDGALREAAQRLVRAELQGTRRGRTASA